MSIIVTMAVILVAVSGVIYFIIIYNGLIGVKNNIDKAWANIDVLLKQRRDELSKLLETCKGYMKYEQELLAKLVELRSLSYTASSVGDISKNEGRITGSLKSLFAVAENYPDLKANQNFLQLQKRISALESEIADRREFYNDSVNVYNIRIQQLPDVFVANILNLEPREMFRVAEADRADISPDKFKLR